MQWCPKQKNSRSLAVLILLCGLIAAVGFVAGNSVQRFAWLFQMICIGGLTGMLYFLIRYRLTWFVYAIRTKSDTFTSDAGTVPAEQPSMHITHLPKDMLDFAVIKGQGQRSGVLECLMGLEYLIEVIPVSPKANTDRKTVDYGKKKYPALVLYDYTITLFWQEALLLIFLDGERHTGVLIEPGEDMRRYLTGTAAGFSGRATL